MLSSSNPAKRRSSAQAIPSKPAIKKTRLNVDADGPNLRSFGDLLEPRTKGKLPQAATTNGVKKVGSGLDESRAAVSGGVPDADVDMRDGTSGTDTSASGSEEDGEEEDDKHAVGHGTSKEKQLATGTQVPEELEAEGPSFGELLRAHGDEPIDVEALVEDPPTHSRALLPPTSDKTLSVPSATSLGTVLTQALRSNDTDLLESCLHVGDLDSIRSTIERLHSSLAGSLLEKLAERIYKRPGRAGSLLVWVQWTFVMHGGYLASQPQIVKLVRSLERVIRERANGLQPLLGLKGRLDMIDAQLELRRRLQRRKAFDEDEEDEDVIFVEGQDVRDTSEDELEQDGARQDDDGRIELKDTLPQQSRRGRKPVGSLQQVTSANGEEEGEEDQEEDMLDMVNGETPDDDDEESTDDESEDLIEDEAEETDDDTGDDVSEDEIDYEDVDQADEGSSTGNDERPPKTATARTR